MVHSGAAHPPRRMRAKLVEIKEALTAWHLAVPEQGRWLGQVVRGYLAYHAVPTNSRKITSFQYHVVVTGDARSRGEARRAASTWARMDKLAARWLPAPGSAIPGRTHRFLVKHPRWEPCAGMPHARICPGGAQ